MPTPNKFFPPEILTKALSGGVLKDSASASYLNAIMDKFKYGDAVVNQAFHNIGTTALAMPLINPIDLGIRFQPKENKVPEHGLTSEECIKLFGAKEAVLMNFIPQMLTAIALEEAQKYIDYCRDNRLCEYKKHNREMRKCIDEYNFELRQSYGQAWYSYQNYLARLRERVDVDLFKCWCTFTNEAARQYIGCEHKEIPARVCFVRMILTFCEDFDKQMDKVIAERLDAPCHRKQDPYIFLISVLCMDIVETFGHKMEITGMMSLCVNILANRCRQIVDEIMSEEDAAESAKT